MATGEQFDALGADFNPRVHQAAYGQLERPARQRHSAVRTFAEVQSGHISVAFSETGLLAYDRSVMQHTEVQIGTVDQDEQIMGFKGLIGATDHRKAGDNVLSISRLAVGDAGLGWRPWNRKATLPAD